VLLLLIVGPKHSRGKAETHAKERRRPFKRGIRLFDIGHSCRKQLQGVPDTERLRKAVDSTSLHKEGSHHVVVHFADDRFEPLQNNLHDANNPPTSNCGRRSSMMTERSPNWQIKCLLSLLVDNVGLAACKSRLS
jgi:hypothetical protein